MKKIIFIIITIFLSLNLVSCKKKNKIKKSPIKVKTEVLKKQNFEKKIHLSSEIQALYSVDIYPKIAAKIIYQLEDGNEAFENTVLKKDQVFAVLENDDLKIGLDQAKANVKMALANMKMAKIALIDAQKDKKRQANLYKEGAVFEKQKELADSNYDRAKAQYILAQARLEEAKAFEKKANNLLKDSYIKSPIDGILAKKYISQYCQAIPNMAIANVVNLDELKILLGVPEKLITHIENSPIHVEVEVDSIKNKKFTFEVFKIHPILDPTTRMATIEMRMKNNNELKPGMYANVTLNFSKKDKAIKVPFSSLIYHDGSYRAYVNKAGKAHLKKVIVGDRSQEYIEVVEGLDEGDELIIVGQNKLTDKIDIMPVYENEATIR